MNEATTSPVRSNTPTVAKRIVVSLASGGLAFLLGEFLSQSHTESILTSTFFGGVVLVAQFLIGMEGDMTRLQETVTRSLQRVSDEVAENYHRVSRANGLHRTILASPLSEQLMKAAEKVGGVTAHPGGLEFLILELELKRLARLGEELQRGRASDDIEDQRWILKLAEKSTSSIKAISTLSVDGKGGSFSGGFWESRLGVLFWLAQKDVCFHGVTVRRIFILEDDMLNPSNKSRGTPKDSGLRTIYDDQRKDGFDVRIINRSSIPKRLNSTFEDYIIFDDKFVYQCEIDGNTASNPPGRIRTEVDCDSKDGGKLLADRRSDFDAIWAEAWELEAESLSRPQLRGHDTNDERAPSRSERVHGIALRREKAGDG